MTTRILLINVHSSCNAGDAALTEVTLEQLQANIPAAKITLSMDDPASHSGDGAVVESLFTWIKQPEGGGRGRWKLASLFWLAPGTLLPILTARISGRPFFRLTPPAWRSTLNAYLQADLVVSKPGGFLYSSGLGLSLLVSLYTMILALAAGKPLYLFPQSIGPFRRGWERWLVRQVLSRARLIMVREEISILELAACGLSRERVQLMPDVAFAFRGAPPAEAAAWRPDLRSFIESRCPLLGITAINWGAQNPTFQHQEAYESACAAAARYFIEKIHGRVIFFPQVWGPFEAQDDRVSARRSSLATSARQVGEPGSDGLSALEIELELFELAPEPVRERSPLPQLLQAFEQVPTQQPVVLEVGRELAVQALEDRHHVRPERRAQGRQRLLVQAEKLAVARRQAVRLGHARLR